MLRADAPSEPGGWRVVHGSGGASPYREIFITYRPINRGPGKPPSHSATPEFLQLLNSYLKDFRRIRLRRGF